MFAPIQVQRFSRTIITVLIVSISSAGEAQQQSDLGTFIRRVQKETQQNPLRRNYKLGIVACGQIAGLAKGHSPEAETTLLEAVACRQKQTFEESRRLDDWRGYSQFRWSAAWALRRISTNPDVVVPVITECLERFHDDRHWNNEEDLVGYEFVQNPECVRNWRGFLSELMGYLWDKETKSAAACKTLCKIVMIPSEPSDGERGVGKDPEEVLAWAYRSLNPKFHLPVIATLGRITVPDDEDTIDTLTELAYSGHREISKAAKEALTQIRQRDTSQSKSVNETIEAAKTESQTSPPQKPEDQSEILLKMAQAPNSNAVRIQAIRQLAKYAGPSLEKVKLAVLDLANDPDSQINAEVIAALRALVKQK